MSIGTVTILIVDDNKNNLLSLRSLIEEDFEHVNVVESLSGLNALSILMKQEVDLIILDIQMPQMDGFETAKIIQSRTKTQHVPIVFLTAAYKSADFKKKGYELGAVDYLTKPIDPDKLVSKLHTYLRFVKQRHQPAPVATPPPIISNPAVTPKIKKATAQEVTKIAEVNESLQDIMDELQTSLSVIIKSSKSLEDKIKRERDSKYISDIEKISGESKELLEFIENVLEPKVLRELCLLISK